VNTIYTMDHIQSLLDEINQDEDQFRNLEIEVRLLMNKAQFRAPRFVNFKYSVSETIEFAKSLLETAGTKTISQSANFISHLPQGNFIKRLVFVNGVQDKSQMSYQTKTPFTSLFLTGKDNRVPDVKVSFAFEEQADPSDAPEVNIVRFKLRHTIIPADPQFDGWQIDITLVKELDGVYSPARLTSARDSLFKSDEIPWDYADRIEIELEREHARCVKVEEFKLVDVLARGANVSTSAPLRDIARFAKSKLESEDSKGFKRLGPAVIELTRSTFRELRQQMSNLWMTDKADGQRAFAIFDPSGCRVITSTNLGGLLLPVPMASLAIADAEFVDGNLYMFDVIAFGGRSVADLPFEERLVSLKKLAGDKANHKKKTGQVRVKEYVSLTGDYDKKIAAFYKKKRPYETDGLIFVAGGKSYKRTENFKWKPLDKMTVDFLARECPQNLKGVKPYKMKKGKTLYFLFSYINSQSFDSLGLTHVRGYRKLFPNPNFKYFPVQFSPSSDPYAYLFWGKDGLDGKIVELGYDPKKLAWSYYRTREDKVMPNNFRIAELTFQNYFNPLTLADIRGESKEGYFQEDDSAQHRGSRHFNSFVKSKLLEPYAGTPWVIDMAGGKGQDIFRYSRIKMQNLVYLEIDKDGISEIIRRKHGMRDNITKIHTVEMDLNQPAAKNAKRIEALGLHLKGKVQFMVCSLAIHYLIGGVAQVDNLIKFITHFLAPGGTFMFTAFDGKSVFDLINVTGKWESRDGDVLRYSIKKAYRSKQFTQTKQKIKVKLPFSGDEYYTEYLVNNEYMRKRFAAADMEREQFASFGTYLEDFAREAPAKFAKLTADDKKYVSLYHYAVFRKAKA